MYGYYQSCILNGCTISASYEVSEAQKALLPLPRTEKGSSTSSEEHYANLPDPTYEDVLHEQKSSSTLKIDKAHLRGL